MTGSQQIVVDLVQMHATCEAARTDAEKLREDLVDVDARVQRGVWFGLNSPSGEVNAARLALLEALRIHALNSGNQITVANQLSAALAMIIGEYAATDRIVSLDIQKVEELLGEALPSKPTSSHWSAL